MKLGAGLLGDWSRRNRETTIPHGIAMLRESGVLANFQRLIGETDAQFRGPLFADSDLYKMLEAIAWELGHEDDVELRRFFMESVELLERAQRDDGYLNTAFQRGEREPWSDFIHGHELYCLGHLIQAAIAANRTIGDARLLAVALKYVDLVINLFGAAESDAYCGHPEIETALVELYRLTADRRHLDLASAFIDRRGSGFIGAGIYGSQYYQDDAPVRSTATLRGHAVRALYLNTGVADLYLETGDRSLLEALQRQWDDLTTRRLYITGGTGARHRDEAFGDGYELPSERAYAETCAGIALMTWAWRMYLISGHARYLDTFETTMYNLLAAGISLNGTEFFYTNPLQRRPDHGATQEEASGARQPWFYCACCPPNIMRTFASIENYAVTTVTDRDELQIGLFTHAAICSTLSSGVTTELTVATDYPERGAIRIDVTRGAGLDAILSLRVPAWCADFEVSVNNTVLTVEPEEGWIRLPGALAEGTVVELQLGLEPKFVRGHPRADGIRGSVAILRGPTVYCLDQSDNAVDIDSVEALLPASVHESAEHSDSPVVGPKLIVQAGVDQRAPDQIPLYASIGDAQNEDRQVAEVVLRPYATWGNTETVSGMRVWIPYAQRHETHQ
ncbi:glycoside hydrolase family 127 protein [Glaciibacter superstes]|uniref:glycoside hydrolase family 127 protein n=1 Tax=Glaciibacter superstes TaxID=501023 RepID=UPI000525EEB8|nr:beta-L-arabinofuranosidase domain-containing protein [Glaciibacter superstes]